MYFAKHETFHIRDGWLYKGLRAIEQDPTIFLSEYAPETLGLGKNMVRALRYWMQATGLVEETSGNHTKIQSPTFFGQLVRTHDPYLENDGTLWMIHYYLVTSGLATSWYWFFNLYAPVEFTREDFIDKLDQWIGLQDEDLVVSQKSLQKDFDCLTRTYLTGKSDKDKSPEDQLDSPLSNLGLLTAVRHVDEETGRRQHHYRFEQANTRNIPPLIFLSIILDRQEKERQGSSQVSLTQVLREPGNVGRVLNIGARDLEEMIMRLEDEVPVDLRIRLTKTGGLDQLTLPQAQFGQVLSLYFSEERVGSASS